MTPRLKAKIAAFCQMTADLLVTMFDIESVRLILLAIGNLRLDLVPVLELADIRTVVLVADRVDAWVRNGRDRRDAGVTRREIKKRSPSCSVAGGAIRSSPSTGMICQWPWTTLPGRESDSRARHVL